jgi:hypothetical protein
MSSLSQQRTQKYIAARQQHPAWLLLASRRAPLMLSCLDALFEHQRDGVPFDAAAQALAEMLAEHANDSDFEIDSADTLNQSRRDMREWIRRGLVVEREGRIFETDALKTALRFIAQLDGRMMTSTASRLAVVQREIDNLVAALDPNPHTRAAHLQRRMADVQQELDDVLAGRITALTPEQAVEGIREVYSLATSLRADFRRVEDSWREADRALRQAIISAQHHRGAVMDQLLDGQASLLHTQEGRVFDSFHEQLSHQTELTDMRQRIRQILSHQATDKALDGLQRSELQLLVQQLIKEAKVVHAVRARSEREVSQFMKTGQAAENHRVGQLLNAVLEQATHVDWQRQSTRRLPAPLPPLGIALGSVPLVERLRIKSLEGGEQAALRLGTQYADLAQMEGEFWQAFEGLDRQALLLGTVQALAQSDHPLTLAELAAALPPGQHDLETLALWLEMAQQAGIAPQQGAELIDTQDGDQHWRFTVPRVALDGARLAQMEWEI